MPPSITAGSVTITTDPIAITVDGTALTGTIAIGRVEHFDPAHYYDPRDLDQATWHSPARAVDVTDDGWLVLDDGCKLRVVADAVAGSAAIELDAGAVDEAVFAQIALSRPAGEPIYGFGESSGGAEATGQVREAQFRIDLDYESSLNEAHVPVPLALWPRTGVGLFMEDRRAGAFDVAARDPGVVSATFTLPDRGPYRAHVYKTATPDPLALVRTYVALTVPPMVPPRWAFAPMQWRNSNESSAEVLGDADMMRSLGIPDSTMWIDNPWQTGYNNFIIDETRFAQPDQLIADLTARGYKVLLWSTPYVDSAGVMAADHAEAQAMNYFVTDEDGRAFTFPWDGMAVGLMDFTRPGATEWWQERIHRVVDRGIRGFKLDYGEDVVPHVGGNLAPFLLAGGDAQAMHGIYQRYYHDAYLGALPQGDAFLLTRAGAWGEQDRNTAIWPGDLDNDFTVHGVDNGEGKLNVGGLPAAIADGLSLSVSGYPFFGSDIGGFRNGAPDTEVLIRWSQYAALGTIMQLGGSGPSHNPWDDTLYDPPALSVYQEYSRLHMDLNPFLWTLAVQAGADGTPVTVPARFRVDCDCDDAMFFVGDTILVAPVITAGATTRDVVLPPGVWRDWWTGEQVIGDGHTSITVPAPLTRMPMWQVDGKPLPMFARPADTLVPATAPGVTSYADPTYGRELRIRGNPIGATTENAAQRRTALHDGGVADIGGGTGGYDFIYDPGTDYDIVTFDVLDPDLPTVTSVVATTETLPTVADETALMACPSPGCYLPEPGRLRVRLFARDNNTAHVAF